MKRNRKHGKHVDGIKAWPAIREDGHRGSADKENPFPIAVRALVLLPSVALGVAAMIAGNVPAVLWGQQAAAWAAFPLLAWPLRQAAKRLPSAALLVLLLIPLAATLFGKEADGARRWLDLGIFHINAAMLVLPAVITVSRRAKNACLPLLAAAAVLCFQPDLSQLAALCTAMLPLIRPGKKPARRIGCAVLISGFLLRCLFLPVSVRPVPYCEGILSMLGQVSPFLQAAGWAALAAVPLFWIHRYRRRGHVEMLCLALYYAVSVLFVLSGEYPVPFMGFGLSPIAGYWLSYACGDD